jgi:uncharacterized membrane protein
MDILTKWILPVLVYSGPVFTYGGAALLFRSRKRTRLFLILTSIHVLAFLPFIYAASRSVPGYVAALIIPAATGFMMFFSGFLYLAFLGIRQRGESA